MDWLAKQFALLGGISFQNWMALALSIIVVGIVLAWWMDRVE
jgi:hypothetical protein